MDIGSVFLILALLLIVGLYVSRPLFERDAIAVSHEEHELSYLMAERDRILNALQELDFDHSMGKIPEADYPAQRAALVNRGADILRQLDKYGDQASEEEWESQIEAAIAARRRETGRQVKRRYPTSQSLTPGDSGGETQDQKSPGAPATIVEADDDLEARIAARRRAKQEKTAGFCPQCGRPVQKSDKFCPNCGSDLTSK